MILPFVKKTYRKISNKVNNTFTLFVWLVFFFLAGSLSVLFVPRLISVFGMYAFPIGGVTLVTVFVLSRKMLQILGTSIKVLIFQAEPTPEELEIIEKFHKQILDFICKEKKKVLKDLDRSIKEQIVDLELTIFCKKSPKNFISKAIGNSWTERDMRVIKSYMKMQKDYLELEMLVLGNSYDNLESVAKAVLNKMPMVDKSQVFSEIYNIMKLEKQRNAVMLERYRLDFKKKASNRYRELRNYLLRVDLYGTKEETRIDDIVSYKMLADGYCPLVSGSPDYKIFWHDIADFDNEYNEKFYTFTSEFTESVSPNVKFVDEPKIGLLQRLKDFFSKKDDIEPRYNRKEVQQNSDNKHSSTEHSNKPKSHILSHDTASALVKQNISVGVGA
ncbi:hypothetical protein CAXC1_40006 [Candidatus Xenohaliotis californiensis]|uniref:Uncharacterized protein n=1 Tax=Candidatus Xenohaliotis californiensis TaxID=84677 RepID=A0ABM9N9W7_9RICK|nr:hypothetical protein CAXC1_40006 [Candidatus Xenohaliotis californiensis]